MAAAESMSNLDTVFASVENETYRLHSMSESPPAPPNAPPCFKGSSFCMLTPLDASIDLHPSGNGYILTHNDIKFQIQVMPPENKRENIVFNCVSNPALMKNVSKDVPSVCFTPDANVLPTSPVMPPMLFPVPIFKANGQDLVKGVTTMHNFQPPAAAAKNVVVKNYEGGANNDVIVNNQQPVNYEAVQKFNSATNFETVQNYNPRRRNCDVFDYAAAGSSYRGVESYPVMEPAYGNSEYYDGFGNITNDYSEKAENPPIYSNSYPTPGPPNFVGRRHGRKKHRRRRYHHSDNVDYNNNELNYYNNDPCTSANSQSMPYNLQQQQQQQQHKQSTTAKAAAPPSIQMFPPMLRPYDLFKCPKTGKLYEVYRQMDCCKRFGIHHDFQDALNLTG